MDHGHAEAPHAAHPGPGDEALTLGERLYLREAIKGMAIVARHFYGRPARLPRPHAEMLDRKGTGVKLMTTVNYPEERKPLPPGYRGMHRLVPREDGKPRCVACYMCATVCPAQCIYIEAGEYDAEGIEKYPVRFEIDECAASSVVSAWKRAPRTPSEWTPAPTRPRCSPATGRVRQGSTAEGPGGRALERLDHLPRARCRRCRRWVPTRAARMGGR